MVVGVYEMGWKWKWDKDKIENEGQKARDKKRWKETSAYQSWANGVTRHWINERTNVSQTTTLKLGHMAEKLVYHLPSISR
jgi:hypothetical protein